MDSNAAKSTKPTQQDVCIDLPGETVQCWRSSDNIRVVLRKHRDVIFDLNLGAGKTYTVQATKSDFYNTRDKKLVYAKRKGVVSFKDGERLHLWVTRNFQGDLILRSGSEILMQFTPNALDKRRYDDDPKTKPAPIIIGIDPSKASNLALTPTHPPAKSATMHADLPRPSAATIDEDCSVICVVDGKLDGIPSSILNYFKKGGGKSGLADIDPNETATRNWIWSQGAGAAAYVGDNWSWLRASLDNKTHAGFRLVTAKIHLVRGKVRFYFSGYSRHNRIFGPGGFGPGNERIMSIFAGAGNTKSAFAAGMKGVFGSFKGFAAVSLIFGSATAYAEWKDDAKKDGHDLAAALAVALLKTIVAAVLVSAFAAFLVMAVMVAVKIAVPVLVVGVVVIALGFFINYGLDAGDKALGKALSGDPTNSDGIAGLLAPWFRKNAAILERNWKSLAEKYPTDYQGISF